ncbi:MAG: stimulus-sensing domain-containing protein [Pseudomonadota bacterium]
MDGSRPADRPAQGPDAATHPERGLSFDDWRGAGDASFAAGARRPSLFGARSPLARKIIAINIVALGALVVGILYLTQFDEALIVERERGLLAEGRVIAQAIAMNARQDFGRQDPGLRLRNAADARRYVAQLGLSSPNRIRLFDREGRLLADSLSVPNAGTVQLSTLAPRQGGLFTPLMDRLQGLVSEEGPIYNETLTPGISSDLQVFRALDGRLAGGRQVNDDGHVIITVAMPIAQNRNVLGAVMMSTRPGEIDFLITNQRAQLIQVFAIALIMSVALSLVLAGTIANPIRRMAEAAEQGEARSSRLMNPERIRIPDLSGRPDEIGYLSGAMRNLTEALYDRIEVSEVFAADVAHEIKNPLTSLRSAVETLRFARDDNARERLLEVIEKDVIRLDRLVTDISNAQRLDGEMVREEMETFSMVELLSNLVEFHGPKAEAQGGKLIGQFPDDKLLTDGIEGRLAQVFVNLVSNAISFTPKGGEITLVAGRMKDGGVRVSISDQGPGIPQENLNDIFSRFYSERPQHDFGKHSGLGLAISKQIVEAHSGRIWAENIRPKDSDPDGPPTGARFTVELPQ